MITVSRPLPNLNREETRPFWEACRRHQLMVQRCNSCRSFIWYPQRICHRCNSWDLGWQTVTGKGKVYSWVIVRHALHPYFADQLPMAVALVTLDDAPEVRFTTTVLDCDPERVYIGMPVEVVFRDVDERLAMPYFRPIRAE